MKQIGIVGLGQFGAQLAVSLSRMGCQVVAADISEARLAPVRNTVDRAVIFDARDYDALRSVFAPDLDEVIVSLGESVEASVLCTLHLKKMGIPYIRAKAANDDHAEILRAVGADQIIFPERETAERLAAQIVNPNLLDFIPLAADYQVVEIVAPESFDGLSIMELDLRKRFNVFVIAVKQKPRGAFVFLPSPDTVVRAGDELVAIGTKPDLDRMIQA